MLTKNGSFWGYVLLFGGSDGAPPWSQMVDMGSLVRDGDGVSGWFDFGF